MTVHEAVERERTGVRRLTLMSGAGAAAAGTLLLLSAGAALFSGARWLTLPRGLPIALWVLVLALNVTVTWWAWRRIRATTVAHIAAEIEREQALRAGALRGALEVGASGALGRRAAQAVARDLDIRGPVLAPTMRRNSSRRAGAAAVAAVVGAMSAVVAAPLFSDGLMAVLQPARAYDGSLVPALTFRGIPAEVLRGENVQVTVAAAGRSEVQLAYRTMGSGWQTARIPVRDGMAVGDLGPMRSTLQVVAGDGRTSTDTASVRVADRPFVGSVTVRAAYPAYLNRAPESLTVAGGITVPRGTEISIAGRSSVALRQVALASGADTIALRVAGHAFDGRLLAVSSRRWEWIAFGDDRQVDVPEPLGIDVIPDSAPVVELLFPAQDTAVAPGERIGLRIAAGDDHGVASVIVGVRLERNGTARGLSRRMVASPRSVTWEGVAAIDPTESGAEAGDVLHIRATATDVSPWAQEGASRTLRVRVRTAEERRDLARALGDSAAAAAEVVARSQRELGRRTEEAARARDRTASTRSGTQGAPAPAAAMSHEAGERARTIAQEQRQLVEKVEALRDAAVQLEKGLREAGAVDAALARQLREAQELIRQALSPELVAQMQRLEESAQQRNREDARDAMRNLAQLQQRLREQLEQSAELLKRAAHEGAMQTLSDEAREVAEKQRVLADSVTSGHPDGAREATALADRSKRYARDVQGLQERLARDKATAAAEGAGESRRAAGRAEERLRESTGPQTAMSPANRMLSQGARDAASQMDRAAEAMQRARDAQVKEWKQELTADLDRAVQETLQMAREERALEQQARTGAAGPGQLRSRQGSVQQGVERTGERLKEAGRRTALLSGGAQRAMAEARAKVQVATRELSQAGSGKGMQDQANALSEAAESLNRAAASLARDRARANSASSASGFAEMMQQLQEMAQQQGRINAGAQSLMQMPGGQQSAQGVQLSRALSRQQQQVAQQLDDIREEAGGGRTGELAREARQLAEALAAGRLDARTAARQEQLFRKLLDAGRALEKEEREDSDRREARASTNAQVHAPDATRASGREAQRFREPSWEELRGLTAEERRVIMEYFRRINAGGNP